jgi:hypothetical protein
MWRFWNSPRPTVSGRGPKTQTEIRGRILGQNPDKSLRVCLLVIHSHLYSFALRFLFLNLAQPLTISVKEKEGKYDRKP